MSWPCCSSMNTSADVWSLVVLAMKHWVSGLKFPLPPHQRRRRSLVLTHRATPSSRGWRHVASTSLLSLPSNRVPQNRRVCACSLAGISILPAPDGPFIHLRSAEPTRLFSSHHRPGSEAVTQPALTCRGLEARDSRAFLRHRSSLVSSLCQAGVLALAACQPAGTGSAQIRWSIAPNRRRVR